MNDDCHVISSELKFEGSFLKLKVDQVADSNGRVFEREVVEHASGVGIIGLVPPDQIVLVKQYRHAAMARLSEIPAGLLETGEEPLVAAKRELFEETGLSAAKITKLLSFYFTPGNSTGRLELFLAENLTGQTHPIGGEEIDEVKVVKLDEALKMVDRGEIIDSKTIIAILLLFYRLKG